MFLVISIFFFPFEEARLEVSTVKPRENPNFMKNGKMVISVKMRNFSRSRMMKRTSPLESSREIYDVTGFRGTGCRVPYDNL